MPLGAGVVAAANLQVGSKKRVTNVAVDHMPVSWAQLGLFAECCFLCSSPLLGTMDSGATDEESSTNLRGDPPDVRIPMMLTKVRRIQMGCHRNQIPLAILSES